MVGLGGIDINLEWWLTLGVVKIPHCKVSNANDLETWLTSVGNG